MNTKKAKELRNLAKGLAPDMPMVAYSTNHQPAQYTMFQGMSIKTAKGTPKELTSDCVRKVYQTLKRQYKTA